MKKTIFSLGSMLMLMLAVFMFSSCSNDDDNGSDGVGTSGLTAGHARVKMTASGATTTNFTSNDQMSTSVNNGCYSNNGAVSVNMTTFKTETVNFLLPINIPTGTYNQDSLETQIVTGFTYVYTNMDGTGTGWTASSTKPFTYTITKSTSAEVIGTFSGTMINEDENTNIQVSGSFAAVY